MSADVRWEHVLEVDFLRETPEVQESRDWSEAAAITPVRVQRENDGLLIELGGNNYYLSNDVIEALYDMHQEVPRWRKEKEKN